MSDIINAQGAPDELSNAEQTTNSQRSGTHSLNSMASITMSQLSKLGVYYNEAESEEIDLLDEFLHGKDADAIWGDNLPKYLGKEYSVVNHLGGSTQNICFKVRQNSTGKFYVLKHVNVRRRSDEDEDSPPQSTKAFRKAVRCSISILKHEAQIVRQQNHPNIIRVVQELDNRLPPFQGIILDCWQDSLYDLSRGRVSGLTATDENVWTFFRQASSALRYLHAKKLCHLDIKPDNVLFNVRNATRSKRRDPELVFCLTDFGSSFYEDDMAIECGTSFFAAPETFERANEEVRGACTASDIWSLLVTCLDALDAERIRGAVGDSAYHPDDEEGFSRLVELFQLTVESDARFVDFKDCLAIDASDRPTVSELIDRQAGMLGFGRRDVFK